MTQSPASTPSAAASPRVAVVVPMPADPDWHLFDHLDESIEMIVVDDSDGNLAPPPRPNVRYYDYAAQKELMGRHYDAIPHKSAATRNFGHVLAYREGFDVVVALDYDCRVKPGWLDQHLAQLGHVTNAFALEGRWINTIRAEGFYARGFPYELRNHDDGIASETTATGEVKLHMGVWDNVLDLNGVDKLQNQPPHDPGLWPTNPIAKGAFPLCGMNTSFRAELIPAYFFLPDVWVNGHWQLSRHDDIWGGYVLEKLMAVNGDLCSFGAPVVEHTRQSTIEGVVVREQYMHLLNMPFYNLVDEAVADLRPAPYGELYAAFVDAFRVALDRADLPLHYRHTLGELTDWMDRWVAAFQD